MIFPWRNLFNPVLRESRRVFAVSGTAFSRTILAGKKENLADTGMAGGA
jgi:hypothetical protein